MRTVCKVALLAKPACLATRCAAPAIGVTNATPFPGRSGARRAMTNSRLALPSASARSFSASPPGLSSMVTTHVSTRVTLSAMVSSSRLVVVRCASGGPPRRCQEAGIRPSMGSVGDAYDNALCESFFATLECELLARHRFRTQAEARTAIFQFIEGFYNPRRRHSALAYLSPAEFERRHVPAMASSPGAPKSAGVLA